MFTAFSDWLLPAERVLRAAYLAGVRDTVIAALLAVVLYSFLHRETPPPHA